MFPVNFLFRIFLVETALLLSCYCGDYVLFNSNSSVVKAVCDNATHGVVGLLSWLIVSVSANCSLMSSIKASWKEILLAGMISSLVDVDHFIQAGSAASNLKTRPFLHCSLLPAVYLLVSLILGFLSKKCFIISQGLMVFSSVFSHHIRDASRRGIWLVGDVTFPLPYASYIVLTLVLPLCYKLFLDLICDRYFRTYHSSDNSTAFIV